MSVVEELRQNDPEMTAIRIALFDETSDLAQALEQNPFVTEIELDLRFNDEQRGDWNSLLHAIATRAILEKVKVQDVRFGQRYTPAALVRSILQAIQQNTAIRNVELLRLRLPTDISTFLDTASSIASFTLSDCDMEPTEREQGTRALAAALQRNTNIETLKLSNLPDLYTTAILESLRSNSSMKTFIFAYFSISTRTRVSDATWHAAVHQLLESTTSLQRFEFEHTHFTTERLFRPIFQAITSSECVAKLRFLHCTFWDTSALIQSILRNKRNLTSLCLQHCRFSAVGAEQLRGAIISTLSRPDSLLQCFEVQGLFTFERQLATLLGAIEKSKLERLTIGPFVTNQQLRTLTQRIPSLRIRELQITAQHLNIETAKQDLFLAMEKNFSLRLVKGKIVTGIGSDLFESARDKQRLAFYANRNESLDQWVDNPERADRKVWPEALALAEKAGPDSLFRGLRSVLGSDSASLANGRKRKRPQY